MTNPEQILLQMMQQYSEASAKWVAQQNEMDRSFMAGEFRTWLRDEMEGAKDDTRPESES